ncbi:unnamed protein product [Clonostachys rosea]|uniref:Anaphase-promoting complex subunit 4 WD40 domain-containing protein n=1 Tax=Bionectria ochroleuca TaxID=29856 RepID=A0ABY6V0S7_BIOOC|nr:unnamed protein product [Clonostachys rosea]
MYTLTTTDEHRFGSDVYVLDLLRTPTGGLVSISSDQKLSLLDPASLRKGPVSSFQTDHGNLTTLRLFGDNVVCTAGENGNVGVWDLRAGAQVVQFATSEAPLASMACNPETQTIAVGTELHNHEASILLWDVRSAPVQKAAYHDLHSDDITTLTYHPSNPNVLLSGSTDGLVSVHDTSITDEDELTVQTLNLNASIHRAGFLGPSLVYALSHDERFAIYDISEAQGSGDAIKDFGDLRGGTGCQYVADIVPKNDGSGAIVGAGAQDQRMFELMFLTNNQGSWEVNRGNSVGLPGAHGEEIVRAYCFFDESQMVFTAGEDGKVKAWRPGN